jgi:hypothetical protein
MDADDQGEPGMSGYLQQRSAVSMGTADLNPPLIGVHRRPSAVNLLLPLE